MNSSKALTGQTVRQYARDVREVIERLGLQKIVLRVVPGRASRPFLLRAVRRVYLRCGS